MKGLFEATSTPAPTTATPNPSGVATSTPDKMTDPPPTVVPASPTPPPQTEQDAQAGMCLKGIALINEQFRVSMGVWIPNAYTFDTRLRNSANSCLKPGKPRAM
jgi:hypothetical protein